jgi:Phosphopantothenoylcysteine decarboxylase (EC 4.1.1.36)
MQREVMSAITSADLLIMNAAVADFRPATASEHKIKKGDDEELTIRWCATLIFLQVSRIAAIWSRSDLQRKPTTC